MAFPAAQTRNTTVVSTAGTSHAINMPSGISAGDLLIAVFAYAITSNTISEGGGTWTNIASGSIEQTGGSTEGISVWYKQAAGGDTLTLTSSVSTKSATVVLRITGHANPATQAPEASEAIGLNAPADPPNLAPTGGAKDYLWIACGANSDITVMSAAPTNYSNLQNPGTTGGAAGTNTVAGTGERQLNAASENPGAFTGPPATAEWCGVTIAIHPTSGQSVTLTVATETDAAQALAFTKTIFKTLTAAVETDAAQALSITHDILVSITAAAETAAAQTLNVDKHKALTPAAETGAAQILSVTKTIFKTLTAAAETDAAQILSFSQGGAQEFNLTPAVETDAAVALTFTKTIFKTLTPAAETGSAQTLDIDKHKLLTSAVEIDVAHQLAITKTIFKTLGIAAETDVAVALALSGGTPVTTFFDRPSPFGGADLGSPTANRYDRPTPEKVLV